MSENNMSPEELEVWRIKDRLISTLEKQGVRPTHNETIAQLIGKFDTIDLTDWIVWVGTPGISNSNVTWATAWTGVATADALVPAGGWTFNVNYPGSVPFRGQNIPITQNNIKLLDFSMRITGTNTTAAAANGTAFTTFLRMYNNVQTAMSTVNTPMTLLFENIPDDGILTRFGSRINNNTTNPATTNVGFNDTTFAFRYVKNTTAFNFTVGANMVSNAANGYMRIAPVVFPAIYAIRKN
jgi:hypothetical protein